LTYSLGLEFINGLDLVASIICLWLELLEQLLCIIDDNLIFQYRTIVRKVDRSGLRGKSSVDSLSVAMPLAECLERRNGLCVIPIRLFIIRERLLLVQRAYQSPFPRPRVEYILVKS
jgi:hypothetical protein